nr:lisH domain-containing protein C1711.05-like isoform X1 [Onthophagus taurus]
MQNYIQEDSMVIDKIVYEVKSQGIFDQFRKECIADVDTKPAYQNLRQRVEGSVSGFLNKQKWSPDMNKNHVREMLRKNIYESGFLETGVERIVDQVVNPKINSIFLPKVSELVYKFFGIRHPTEEKKDSQPSQSETLLPTDLEAVSPESDKHSELGNIEDQTLDDSKIDEDESPPFEPLEEQGAYVAPEETSIDSHMSGFSGLISHDSNGHEISKPAANETSNQESITSKQSSDRLSIVMSDDNDTKMEIDEPKIEKNKNKDDKEKKSKDDKNKDEKSHRSRHDSRSDKREKDRKDSKDYKHRDHDKSKDRKDSSSKNGKSDKDKEKEKSKSHSSSSHRHSSSSHRSHKDSSSSSRSKSKVSSSSSKESSKDKYKDDKKKDSKRHHSSSSSSDKHKKDNHHSSHHSKTSSSRSKDKKDSKNKDKKDCESDTKKRSDRRSTDRDSNDGHSSLKSTSSSFESFSSNVQSSQQEKKSSNNTNSGDSGNSDMVDEVSSAVNLDEEISISSGEIKLFKPKFASNFQEAKRLMKIRKKLAEIEKERNNHKLFEPKSGEKPIKTLLESPPLPSVNVSAASWDALEAKLNETIAKENCYVDESSYGSDVDEKDVNDKKNEMNDEVYYLKTDDSPKTKRYRDFLSNYLGKIEKGCCDKTKINLRSENLKRKLDANSDIKNNNKKFSIEVHENFSLPLSPAESDNSIDKKSDISEASIYDKAKRTIKATSNSKNRYSSEDLYKPRLSFSSSRRRMKKNAGID